jgi:general stress protein YciG
MGRNDEKKGIAVMDPARQREIASKGGKAAHAMGRAHEFTSVTAKVAGKKGGTTVSQDRLHMQTIGRRGGVSVSSNRAHMSEIGKKGASSTHRNPEY